MPSSGGQLSDIRKDKNTAAECGAPTQSTSLIGPNRHGGLSQSGLQLTITGVLTQQTVGATAVNVVTRALRFYIRILGEFPACPVWFGRSFVPPIGITTTAVALMKTEEGELKKVHVTTLIHRRRCALRSCMALAVDIWRAR